MEIALDQSMSFHKMFPELSVNVFKILLDELQKV